MRNLLVILLITIAAAGARPGYLQYNQAFGIKASNISGYGAFYGYKPTEKTRLQLTGIYYLFDAELQDEQRQITNYTVGLEFQRDIIQEMKYRVYLMAGGYYYHDDDNTIEKARSLRIVKESYNAGFGIGYEYFFHRVSLGTELGYKLYRDTWTEQDETGKKIPVLERVSKIGAGINLGFIF